MIENSHIAKNILRIGPIEEIEPHLLKTPMIGDLCTDMYHKVDTGKPVMALTNGVRIIMYMEDVIVKPPLGEIIKMHQAYENTDVCLYCGKPVKEWGIMEKCPAMYPKKIVITHDDNDEQHLMGQMKNILNERYCQRKLTNYDIKIEKTES